MRLIAFRIAIWFWGKRRLPPKDWRVQLAYWADRRTARGQLKGSR